jgi:hypothetical protein
MTIPDAAAALGVTPAWVWRLIKRGTIAAEKRGRDWWIEPVEIERYRREKKPAHRPANVANERGSALACDTHTASESHKPG